MSSSGVMATDLALALGMPRHDMVQVVKVARQAGLINKTSGRGTSAVSMNADDAVSMLFAAVSDTNPKDLAKAVKGFKKLPLKGVAGPDWKRAQSDECLGQLLVRFLEESGPGAAMPELELGMNIDKSGGYVIVRTDTGTAVYASWNLRNDCGQASPLNMFERQPPLLRASYVRSEVFAALRASLQKPVPRERGGAHDAWVTEPDDEPMGMRP